MVAAVLVVVVDMVEWEVVEVTRRVEVTDECDGVWMGDVDDLERIDLVMILD